MRGTKIPSDEQVVYTFCPTNCHLTVYTGAHGHFIKMLNGRPTPLHATVLKTEKASQEMLNDLIESRWILRDRKEELLKKINNSNWPGKELEPKRKMRKTSIIPGKRNPGYREKGTNKKIKLPQTDNHPPLAPADKKARK